MKRVVITSSAAVEIDLASSDNGKIHIEKDWNRTTWEQGRDGSKQVAS